MTPPVIPARAPHRANHTGARAVVAALAAVILAPLALAAPFPLGAQQPPPPPPAAQGQLSRISGFVFDSIRAEPIVGARVRVQGTTTREGVSREDGSYEVDSIPPGEATIQLLHPMLDSLGIVIGTRPVAFPVPDGATLNFTTPSEETLVGMFCAPAWRARGPGVVAGRVLDADTFEPATGTKVSVAWFETVITTGTAGGIRRTPRVREATVQEDGTYRICGLPADLDGTVQAQRGSVRTTEVKVNLQERGSGLALIGLKIGSEATVVADAATDSSGDRTTMRQQTTSARGPLVRGRATVTGRVQNAAGAPVAGARVDVAGAEGATLTKADGTFSLGGLPSGTQTLVVRQIGFAPVEQIVELSARRPQEVAVTMSQPARVLETVEVKAERDDGLERVGFARRSKMGLGHFMSTEDIEQRNPQLVTDLFRGVPGLRVSQNGMNYQVESTRGPSGCVVYYVDGAPWEAMFAGDVDRIVPPTEIGAVEVFNPGSAPAEFQRPGQSSCTSIAIWTRTRLRSVPRR